MKKIRHKIHLLKAKYNENSAISSIEQKVPILAEYMLALTNQSQVGVSGYPWRMVDIFKVLDDLSPKSVIELGSGTSTAVFATYVASMPSRSLLSIDESEQWGGLTRSALERVGLLPNERIDVQVFPRVNAAEGSHYNFDLPQYIDLLYIDGPSVLSINGKKQANQDIFRALERGFLPKAIMIDGRVDTVDAIRRHPLSNHYKFTPGMTYLAGSSHANLADMISWNILHRHSVFLLR